MLTGALVTALNSDTPSEEAAAARVTAAWTATLTRERPIARPRRDPRRWMTASASLALAMVVFAIGAATAPSRAMGSVSRAMAAVPRFHLRMEVPELNLAYEAWGERGRAARVEERQSGALSLVILDDGARLRSYDPRLKRVSQGQTRLKRFFRETLGFSATRMLRKAARGRLFEGQEWLGEAQAREVAQVRRNGVSQRRLQVDLKDGFFARMVIYAEVKSDRLTQANLYLHPDTPEEDPSARVVFDYPERLEPTLFTFTPPKGAVVRNEEIEFP